MVWFLLIFIIIDIFQTLYIRHLKKELAFRDKRTMEEDRDDDLITVHHRPENRVWKFLKEFFWV